MEIVMRYSAVVLALLLPLSIYPQQTALTKIKVRFKDDKKQQQVDQDAALRIDDSARRLVVISKEQPRELSYDDVQKIIIEPDSHAGNIGFGAALAGFAAGGLLFGGKIATAIDNPLKADHVVYIEPKNIGGKTAPLVLVLGKDVAPEGLKRIKAAFGDLVVVPVFDEQPEPIDKKQFKSVEPFEVKGSAQEPPLPAVRAEQALVVVAAPVGGSFRPIETNKNTPFYAKVLVNDRVLAVNAPGSYSFFYLDPGEHLLVTQALVDKKLVDVTGLRLKAEAGKEYYLTQTIYISGGMKSFLSRHSKEVLMQEVNDLLWSEWKPKKH
jgi:hypothetical protein